MDVLTGNTALAGYVARANLEDRIQRMRHAHVEFPGTAEYQRGRFNARLKDFGYHPVALKEIVPIAPIDTKKVQSANPWSYHLNQSNKSLLLLRPTREGYLIAQTEYNPAEYNAHCEDIPHTLPLVEILNRQATYRERSLKPTVSDELTLGIISSFAGAALFVAAWINAGAEPIYAGLPFGLSALTAYTAQKAARNIRSARRATLPYPPPESVDRFNFGIHDRNGYVFNKRLIDEFSLKQK